MDFYKILLLGTGLLSMTACSDFLEQTAPSEMTNQQTFDNEYYTQLALNNVYGGLTEDKTYSNFMPIIAGTNSDCELIDGLGADANNTSSERGNMNYNANPGWADLARVWDAMYAAIEDANLVIDGVNNSNLIKTEGSSKDNMLRYQAEAKTLRAMLYLDLIRLFGDVPFKVGASEGNLGNVYVGKTDRDEIMDSLIVDLEDAINHLPWAGENGYTTEHITKGYAHGLLANIALTRAGWAIREKAKDGYETASENSDPTYPTQRCDEETRKKMYELAETHLAAIINSGKHGLTSSLDEYWRMQNVSELNKTKPENLFEIPMGLNKSGELGYTIGYRINGATPEYGAKGNSSGKLKLTAPYYMSFADGDERRDLTVAITQYGLDKNTNEYKETMLGNAPFQLYCCKWDYRKMKANASWYAAVLASDQKVTTGINVVKMRYAQVLLMYAEVVNELKGKNGTAEGCSLTAEDALKAVHDRAFTDAAQRTAAWKKLMAKDFFDAVVDEEAWELAGEGVRKFDLIRWNLLSKKIDQFKTAYETGVFNGTYPTKIYFKYKTDDPAWIDMSTVTYTSQSGDGWQNKSFFGAEATDKTQKQILTNLPSISAGLNTTVKNRYLLPIASTTISTSQGKLHNSYGYAD